MRPVYHCSDCSFDLDINSPNSMGVFTKHLMTEKHHSGGTVDLDTGEIINKPRKASKKKGQLPADIPDTPTNGVGTETKKTKTVSAVIPSTNLRLSTKLHVLYDAAKAAYPQYDKDMSGWAEDCIFGFCLDHARELGLHHIFSLEEQQAAQVALSRRS